MSRGSQEFAMVSQDGGLCDGDECENDHVLHIGNGQTRRRRNIVKVKIDESQFKSRSWNTQDKVFGG
jgi:hypothetical protein